ncbi:hypothetical protein AB0L59_02100 [Streptomyces sp. NPDC052109]|uniref:hypothetical protein n=1 Tax=Streptomyces sp. NPDC052109 TaxID=3155527 RepID=UPI0034379497
MLCPLLHIPLAACRRVLSRLGDAAVSEIRVDGDHAALLSPHVPCEGETRR